MRRLSIIDSHCDTAFEIYHKKESLDRNSCHISLQKAQKYENYAQFFAIWADKRRSDDECFEDFLKISDNLLSQTKSLSDKMTICRTYGDMASAWSQGKRAAFPAVEDARILGGNIHRFYELKARGVKYITLLWGGKTCIGSSHDEDGGLTDFGRQVVHLCFENGIIPDVSHANARVTDEVAELAFKYQKPFMASHSNCYDRFGHTRNLRSPHLRAIITLGGAVGLNLCPYHIKDMRDSAICTLDDVISHVDKYMELGAENVLGLGCDLDGTDLPDGFSGVDDLEKLADGLARIGYSDELIDKIFYKNHLEFIKRNFT